LVKGIVRSGKPCEDEKAHAERDKVEKLLVHWDWPAASEIERPAKGTYDFDCVHAETCERVAVEIKWVTFPQQAMIELHKKLHPTDSTDVNIADFLEVPAERLREANEQLAAAPVGARRCALLVSPTEAEFDWSVLVTGVGRLDLEAYANIDEVWLTTPNLTRFLRA
jgi:hypothetical protein